MKTINVTLKDLVTKRFGLGSIIGFSASQLLLMLSMIGQTNVTIDVKGYLGTTAMITLLVGYLMAASVVYQIETLPLTKRTVFHLILMLPYFPVGYQLEWLPESIIGMVVYGVVWLVIYASTWLVLKNIFEKKMA